MATSILSLYRRLQAWPAGGWLFSRAVCLKAPYFSSISPRITALETGRCEARITHRRRITNHLGTVHAIALCNLAELTAGLMTDASLPGSMRWIPKGMQVEYLKKAIGTQRAIAVPGRTIEAAAEGYALPVEVTVLDDSDAVVFRARVEMWVSPKPKG